MILKFDTLLRKSCTGAYGLVDCGLEACLVSKALEAVSVGSETQLQPSRCALTCSCRLAGHWRHHWCRWHGHLSRHLVLDTCCSCELTAPVSAVFLLKPLWYGGVMSIGIKGCW